MPFGNVFEKINSEYYQLTSAEKKVADYAVIHQQKTQFMSISELAEEAGVAEATISRFCKRLGYKGYSAFKLAVAILFIPAIIPAKKSSYFKCVINRKVYISFTTKSICTKILTHYYSFQLQKLILPSSFLLTRFPLHIY